MPSALKTNTTQKKLLIVGPTTGSVHVRNFYFLIKDYFDDVLIACNGKIDFCDHRVLDFSVKNPLKVFPHIRKVRKLIAEFKPDVIHIHQSNTLAFIVTRANRGKIPTVLTCWGSDVLVLPQRSLLLKKIVSYSLRKATAVTVDAAYMNEAVIKLTGRRDIVVVNFGIELEGVRHVPKEKIIYSNRLHKSIYRINHIIEAFAVFLGKNPGWKLIIGANGESTPELKALASSLLPGDAYEFIGFVDAKTNLEHYLKATIWVSVPETDGTAISLLEAMGYGCIPVVSDLPANREWIVDGKNGCIVKTDLATTFETAMGMDISDVQRRNTEIVHQKATKSVNRKLFYAIYNEILSHQ